VYGVLVLVLLLDDEESPGGTRALVGGLCVYLAFAHAVTSAVCLVVMAASAVHALVRRKHASALWHLGLAAVLTLLYVVLNRAPYPSLRGEFAWANLGEAARYLRPWLLPSLSVVVLAGWALRRRLPGLRPLAPLGLGVAYYLFGMTLADPGHRWFVAYNAERFPHYALLVALILLPLLPRAAQLASLAPAIAGLVLLPPALARNSIQLLTEEPLRLPAATLRVWQAVRTRTPPQARILVLAHMYAPAAFTGRAQAPIEPLELWSMNALPVGEVAQRQREWAGFVHLAQAERERIVAERGYTHLVLRPPDDSEPERFVQGLLPSHHPQLLFAEAGVFVFALPSAH
jgi:hypothetical protein